MVLGEPLRLGPDMVCMHVGFRSNDFISEASLFKSVLLKVKLLYLLVCLAVFTSHPAADVNVII